MFDKHKDKVIFNLEEFDTSLKKMQEELRAGHSCSVFGVQNSMRAAFVSSLKSKVLYLTSSDVLANIAISNFELMGFKVFKYNSIQDEFLYKKAQSNELLLNRLQTLSHIISGDYDIIVAEVSSLFSPLPSPEKFIENTIVLKNNQDVDVFKLEKQLINAGYAKEEMISQEGQFSRRGEVLDVFPLSSKYPFRIDFFDTQIESIKIFDLVSQKPTKEVEQIKINPNCDLFFNENEFEIIKKDINNIILKVLYGCA